MKTYNAPPKSKKAREVWVYFVRKNGEPPITLKKIPNNFKIYYSIEGGGWGMWLADYGNWIDYYNPQSNEINLKRENLFSFIGKQSILSKLAERFLP